MGHEMLRIPVTRHHVHLRTSEGLALGPQLLRKRQGAALLPVHGLQAAAHKGPLPPQGAVRGRGAPLLFGKGPRTSPWSRLPCMASAVVDAVVLSEAKRIRTHTLMI